VSSNLSLIEQNRLLSQEVKRRIDQMSAINAVASAVGHTLDLDKTLETALQVVLDVVGAEASGISLIDEDAGELVLRAQLGWTHDFVTHNPMRIPLGQGMSGTVIENNDMVVNNHLDGTEELAFPSFSKEAFKSIAMAPMHARGTVIGILSIMSNKYDSFNEDIVNVLRVIADTVGVALENARLYETAVEEERRLAAVLDSTADGIIATDRAGRISMVNHMAETMLRANEDDLIGVPLREAPIPDAVCESLIKALASRGDDMYKSFKVTLEDERVLAVSVSPVIVESQLKQTSADGWVIVLQDVTHQREAEIARAEFIQDAAHDMRNPLSVTRSALGMLQNMVEDKSGIEVIDLAMGGVERLQGLIDDLLQLEHIESGYDFNLIEFNLGDVLNEVVKETQALLSDRDHTCKVDLPEKLPFVKADIGWIKRSLHNYLGNAIKYTPDGGELLLKAYTQGDFVHLEVSDNGPGIPQKDQPRLFERFYRVSETQTRIKGSGLGLAIVKSVAEAHGGSVYVRSKPNEGSTFGFTLPVSEQGA